MNELRRSDKRAADGLRPVKMSFQLAKFAEGSVLYEQGQTKVLCTASVQDSVPPFLRGKGRGWVTAEYGMLPRATHTRTDREAAKGKQSGRTQEIQRLIGRALRQCVNLKALGERSVVVDCDVVQADGGTRTASITGGCVALMQALGKLVKAKRVPLEVFVQPVAAVSVGMVGGRHVLDLNYEEDSTAEVDMNVVSTGEGKLVELQGTAEHQPFSVKDLEGMVALAQKGLKELFHFQHQAVKRFKLPFP